MNLEEMTGFMGSGVQTDTKMQGAFDHLIKYGKHHGNIAEHQVVYFTRGNEHTYGIKKDNTLTTIAALRDHPNIDKNKTLELMFIHTLTQYRNQDMTKRLLWFIKDQEQVSIIDYGMQSKVGTDLIKSLGKTQRYTMFWYNTDTKEKHPYDHTADEIGKEPYRSMGGRTPWRILIEKSENVSFPRFGEYITLGETKLYLYDVFPVE